MNYEDMPQWVVKGDSQIGDYLAAFAVFLIVIYMWNIF